MTRNRPKNPQKLADLIERFLKAVPEWVGAPAALGAFLWARDAVVHDRFQNPRLALSDNWVAETKGEVLAAGEALAAALEAQHEDPLPVRELLAHVERNDYNRVNQIWPHVKAFLQGAPARLRERADREAQHEGRGEIITSAVAVKDFHVSARTLRRLVKDGALKDYRPRVKRGTTSPLKLSRAELSRRYTQQKK